VPYLSRWWTLDLLGLNTASIATAKTRNPSLVLDQKPDVIVLVSSDRDRFEPYDWNAWETSVYAAAIAGGFERVTSRRFDEHYWLWVLARPLSRAGQALLGP